MKPAAERAIHRRRMFWWRMALHSSIAFSLLGLSLVAGMLGFRHYEQLPWRDTFVNAAMLLSGMGPMKTDLSDGGKVFAGLYALYSGIVVIAVAGLLLAPAIHRVMHRVHWDDQA